MMRILRVRWQLVGVGVGRGPPAGKAVPDYLRRRLTFPATLPLTRCWGEHLKRER